jgi:sec-independent protein translocase protein TatA
MFGGFGVGEILVIAVLLILFFGSRKIPEIARGLGRGIRNFKADVKDPERLEEDGAEPSDPKRPSREEDHEGR